MAGVEVFNFIIGTPLLSREFTYLHEPNLSNTSQCAWLKTAFLPNHGLNERRFNIILKCRQLYLSVKARLLAVVLPDKGARQNNHEKNQSGNQQEAVRRLLEHRM